jgi:hypothetical protein
VLLHCVPADVNANSQILHWSHGQQQDIVFLENKEKEQDGCREKKNNTTQWVPSNHFIHDATLGRI